MNRGIRFLSETLYLRDYSDNIKGDNIKGDNIKGDNIKGDNIKG